MWISNHDYYKFQISFKFNWFILICKIKSPPSCLNTQTLSEKKDIYAYVSPLYFILNLRLHYYQSLWSHVDNLSNLNRSPCIWNRSRNIYVIYCIFYYHRSYLYLILTYATAILTFSTFSKSLAFICKETRQI